MFYYSRPDERAYSESATGTVDTDFSALWLMDGRANFPAKVTGALSIVSTLEDAVEANLFALINHNVDENIDVTFTHGAGGGIVTPDAWGADLIPYNPYLITPGTASASSTTVASSGNSEPYIIGEAWVGLARQFPHRPGVQVDFLHGVATEFPDPYSWESQLAPYDDGTSSSRELRGTIVTDAEGYAEIVAWYESTRRGTKPSLIIPDDAVNDAWLVTFSYAMRKDEGFFYLDMTFNEIPRQRW